MTQVFCSECDNFRHALDELRPDRCVVESNIIRLSPVDRDRISYRLTPVQKNGSYDCEDFVPRRPGRKLLDISPVLVVACVILALILLIVIC
jgi:hypothetical protein